MRTYDAEVPALITISTAKPKSTRTKILNSEMQHRLTGRWDTPSI